MAIISNKNKSTDGSTTVLKKADAFYNAFLKLPNGTLVDLSEFVKVPLRREMGPVVEKLIELASEDPTIEFEFVGNIRVLVPQSERNTVTADEVNWDDFRK